MAEMDLYVPPDATGPLPAVVIVAGYPGRFNTLEPVIAWAKRIQASGMIAVAYGDCELPAMLEQVRAHARIDANRLALFAISGNVALALSALRGMRCAALLYGCMLDLDERTTSFGFADPRTRFEDIPRDVPLLLVRAGRDQFAGINESIDRFVANSLAHNLPVTLINHPEAAHGDTTAEVVRQTLDFLRSHFSESVAAPSTSSSARS